MRAGDFLGQSAAVEVIMHILLGIGRVNTKKTINLPSAFNQHTRITGHTPTH